MKNRSLFLIQPLVLVILATLFTNCSDTCDTTSSYTYYEPVYTSLEEIRTSVAVADGREINQAGKIYLLNDYLLINEPGKGIHIINNEDPTNPTNLAFITIPGNYDMAAVDGYLFADSYVDLVVIDISDLSDPKEVRRVKDLFPNYNGFDYYGHEEEGIITDWKEVEQISNVSNECDQTDDVIYYDWGFAGPGRIAVQESFSLNDAAASGSGSPGIGGSMARFTINSDHLFMIDQSEMHVVDISNPEEPVLGTRINVGWGIETIFPYEDMIFIGANNGMFIYDVSDPFAPNQLSNYSHVTSCDPVVTDGRYAYVTLRSGTECAGFTNQLEVIDIADPSNPELLETYPMYNPHGLSISDGRLFVCDGQAGLKIYNAFDIHNIDDHMIKNYGDIHAYDVIVRDCQVMLIGNDGLFQYHCNDFEEDIVHLSTIPFNPAL